MADPIEQIFERGGRLISFDCEGAVSDEGLYDDIVYLGVGGGCGPDTTRDSLHHRAQAQTAVDRERAAGTSPRGP
jgi:hypothetical protein